MNELFSRTELLVGKENIEKLKNANVLIIGIGGVGSFSAEGLARAGVCNLCLIDNDIVSKSNINRQIIALHSTIGKAKVDVMRDRILDINPDCNVTTKKIFVTSENIDTIDFSKFDYIIDAIDTITSKILIIQKATLQNVAHISCMGTGNKITADFIVDDIKNTVVCPLAKVMRHELKVRGILSCKVIYSKDKPTKPTENISDGFRRVIPGSISYTPSMAGLLAAREAILSILGF
ncbi:MAG: tRNA threonylcarbamoyladenosine dehydratase [Clostridia bacterium]